MKKESKFNLLDYLYYRTVLLYSKVEKGLGLDDNKNTAIILIAMCLSFNCNSIFFFLNTYLDNIFLDKYSVNNLFYVFGGFFVIVLLASLYFFKKEHHIIFEKYENESSKEKKVRGGYALSYVLLSVLLFIISVVSSPNFKG